MKQRSDLMVQELGWRVIHSSRVAFIVIVALWCPQLLPGQAKAALRQEAGETAPLVIQQVPAADLAKFLSQERPLRRAAFDEYLKSLTSSSTSLLTGPPPGVVSQAKLEAQFTADRQLSGKASIEFLCRGDGLFIFPTPDLIVAVDSLHWKGREDAPQWGLSPDGRLVLLVQKSGTLEFTWSSTAAKVAEGNCEFEVAVIKARKLEFSLTSPKRWRPSLENVPTPEAIQVGAVGARYDYFLGATAKVKLRLEEEGATLALSNPTSVRQKTRIEVGRQGIEHVSEFFVDPGMAALSEVSFRMDKTLQLVAANMGDLPLRWTSESTPQGQTITFHFNPPISGEIRRIRLDARLGGVGHEIANLPLIRPLENNWTEADVEIHTSPPLELIGLELDDARLIDSGSTLQSRAGETRGVRLYSANSNIRCGFRVPEPRGELLYLARLSASESAFDLKSEYLASLQAGELFEITTIVPSGWIIDYVESSPAGAIESWAAVPEGSRQRLNLRLAGAFNPKSPLRFKVSSHLPRVGNEPLAAAMLFHGQVEELRLQAGYLQLASDSDIGLYLLGEITQPLDSESLKSVPLESLAANLADPLFAFSATRDFSIAQRLIQVESSVESLTQVVIDQNRIVSRHEFKVTSQRHPQGRLHVRLKPATGRDVSFVSKNAPEMSLNSRLLTSGPEGDRWEVRLTEPMAGRTEFVAIENEAVESQNRVRIPKLEESVARDARLQVYSTRGEEWEVDAKGVEPTFAAPHSNPSLALVAAARFESFDSAEVSIRRAFSSKSPRAWAWSELRETLLSTELQSVDQISVRMVSEGPTSVLFTVPQGAKVTAIDWNGSAVSTYETSQSELRVTLPSARGEGWLQVRTENRRKARPTDPSAFEWAGPTPQFAVLSTHWRVWAPPNTAVDFDSTFSVASTNRLASSLALCLPTSVEANPQVLQPPRSNSLPSMAESLLYPISGAEKKGWRPFLHTVRNGELTRAKLYSESSWRMAGWSVLAAIVLTSMLVEPGPRSMLGVLFLAALASAIASLLTPMPYQLVASGGFLGSTLGLMSIFAKAAFAFRWENPVASTSSTPPVRASSITTAALLASFSILQGSSTSAQPPPVAKSEADSKPILRNAIDPIDADGKPVGDYIYLSPELFDEIAQKAPLYSSESCLLETARYRIARAVSPQANTLPVSLELTYQAFAESQMASLPIDLRQQQIEGNVIFVDGERREIGREGKNAYHLQLLGRGAHFVRLDLQLPIQQVEGKAVAAWKCLPIAQQRLEIEADSSTSWTFNGEEIKHDPLSRLASLRLGPKQSVKLAFQKNSENAPPILEQPVNLDTWFTIAPGAMKAEHLVQLEANSLASSIDLQLDEGVQLQSITDGNRTEVNPIALGNRRWRVPLEARATQSAALRIACSVKSGLGLRRIISTGISFPGTKLKRQRIAASASADFNLSAAPRAGVSEISPAAFMDSWPSDRTPPQLALEVETSRDWSMDLLLRDAIWSVQQRTEIVVHPERLQVQLVAEMGASGNGDALFTIRTPPDFQVESVAVLEGAANRLLRYVRTSPQRLTVFLRSGGSETRQLRLRGSLPIDASSTIAMPQITIEHGNLATNRISLFRVFESQVELSRMKALKPVEGAADRNEISELQPQYSRLVGQWEAPVSGTDWECTISSTPQRPKVAHESRLRLEMLEPNWRFQQTLTLDIQSGQLDEIHLDLPAGFSEPISVDPPATTRVYKTTEAVARLIVTPETPWQGLQTLTLSGVYSPPVGVAEISLSPIRLQGPAPTASWIAVPRRFGGRELNWRGQDAIEAPPPPGEPGKGDWRWFKLRAQTSMLQLAKTRTNSQAKRTRVDSQIFLSESEMTAILRWYWPHSTQEEVNLSVPQGIEILSAQIDGADAHLSQISEGQWRLPPGALLSPPILEVICRGKWMPGQALPLPFVMGTSPVASVISVHHLPSVTPSRSTIAFLAPKANASLARLRLLDQVRREVQPTLAALDSNVSARWKQEWSHHWDAAINGEPSKTSSPVDRTALLPGWFRESEQFRAQMEGAEANEAATAESPPIPVNFAEQWRANPSAIVLVEGNVTPVLIFTREGEANAWVRALASDGPLRPWLLLVGGIAFLLALNLVGSFGRRTKVRQITPLLAGLFMATIWWCYLTPAWVGPLVVAIGLLSAAPSRWAPVRNWSRHST